MDKSSEILAAIEHLARNFTGQLNDFKAEVRGEFTQFRAEVQEEFAEVRKQLAVANTRLDSFERQLDSFHRRLDDQGRYIAALIPTQLAAVPATKRFPESAE
jgi:septal ring factor EnvC (AmiA/AmiB activator)